MELAQNPNQNDIWSCEASSAAPQAGEQEADFEQTAPTTSPGRGSAGPYSLHPQL